MSCDVNKNKNSPIKTPESQKDKLLSRVSRMAESTTAVQCTDTCNHNGSDVLAPIVDHLGHRVLPEEVQHLYDDATLLAQKNQNKDDYIKELEQKLQGSQQQIFDLKRQLDNYRREESCDERRMVSEAADVGERGWSESRVNQDLKQSLLLKIGKLETENKELREMYGRVVKEKEEFERLGRQLLRQEEKIQQLQDVAQCFAEKEEECHAAQKKVKELQVQIEVLQAKAENLGKLSVGLPDEPVSGITEDHSSGWQDTSSIHLHEQTSPPLKRGRFTMEKKYPYECSNCSVFFVSIEEAAKTDCRYHTKVPVPAILRHGSGDVDPVKPPDVFWPCCQRIGRQAVKCARGGTHKFTNHGGSKNPEG